MGVVILCVILIACAIGLFALGKKKINLSSIVVGVVIGIGVLVGTGCSKPYTPWTGTVAGQQQEQHGGIFGRSTSFIMLVQADSDGKLYPVDIDVTLSVCPVGTKVTVSRDSIEGC